MSALPLKRSPADLLDGLPPALQALLRDIAAVAARRGERAWLVGGVIRDLLLGQPIGRDLDLGVEGDVAALAPALAETLGGRLLASYAPFGTATLAVTPAGAEGPISVDLARARSERYTHPAALPEVWPATMAEDLARRDFSVNAMALELIAAGGALTAGRWLDPLGGLADLAAGRLRLLHPLSLRDDPTRLLRGLRLAARLSLAPDPATEAEIGAAIAGGYLGLLSAERIRAELCLALEEPRPDAVLDLADSWGITHQLIPGLSWRPALAERCGRLAAGIAAGGDEEGGRANTHGRGAPDEAAPPLLWLGLLAYDLDDGQRAALARRYHAPTAAARLLEAIGPLRRAAAGLGPDMPPSAIDRRLRAFSPTAVALLAYAEPPPASALARRYLREIAPAAPPLNGDDLRQLGVAPGPLLGRLLDELRGAYLDGRIDGRAAAEAWVRSTVARMDDGHNPH